jgi:hypothetical protein
MQNGIILKLPKIVNRVKCVSVVYIGILFEVSLFALKEN